VYEELAGAFVFFWSCACSSVGDKCFLDEGIGYLAEWYFPGVRYRFFYRAMGGLQCGYALRVSLYCTRGYGKHRGSFIWV
jgi:hypothetical protein